ncbi:MAG: bifunctional UDP-N-acetylglucosamine diphosphorylase/glucosamine-1-phosphate N-acetyltransferase GlmU [Candidatus Abyssobacteria bacterium SURF_17]|uniref:Bifunctional protein GlmU n=1 Tax=Candidatus Abyssobacteria bacterium SURF_17 TaxID=2093361 RepID=A0A419EZJ9_9BACT|nr:MAG: bifunctional UDP-N-acetylglucosamine diphosphorylase/glucosamine-1-phosphate N-acetyltransferase GlmU [Candidatus Abyssubacteria bacterium SURF_17]
MVKKEERPFVCAILAAGQGTRMKSDTPKVLHKVCGRPMIDYIVRTARNLKPARTYLIVGFKEELVRQFFGKSVHYITQSQQLGTGHAVLQARDRLFGYDGDVLVLYGDVPLITEQTLLALLKKHRETAADATLVTARVSDPTGFGRIIRNRSGKLSRIVEEKDATAAQKRIRDINPGIYCFKAPCLLDALSKISTGNKQQEYYLTDVIEILAKEHKRLETISTDDEIEIMQVNTRKHLAQANRILHDRVLERLMNDGVTIIDARSTFISETVKVERDVTIYPFTYIEGYTRIGEGTVIGPQTYITDSEIGRGVVVVMSYLSSCIVRDKSRIGPYTHLRPETIIGEGVHIGNFVEVKKSLIEDDSKANHLSYIGDAKIGKGVNIGAGTITANYDGERKSETVIEDGASIGSGTVLIAPVRVGKKAVTGAGAIVPKRHDIPPYSVFVGMPAHELKKGE